MARFAIKPIRATLILITSLSGYTAAYFLCFITKLDYSSYNR
jgi:hypothetical protein